MLAFAWTASASARGQDRGRCPFSTRHSALNPSSPLSPYSVSTTKRERGRSISVVSSIHHLAPSSLKHGTWDQLRRPASRYGGATPCCPVLDASVCSCPTESAVLRLQVAVQNRVLPPRSSLAPKFCLTA